MKYLSYIHEYIERLRCLSIMILSFTEYVFIIETYLSTDEQLYTIYNIIRLLLAANNYKKKKQFNFN